MNIGFQPMKLKVCKSALYQRLQPFTHETLPFLPRKSVEPKVCTAKLAEDDVRDVDDANQCIRITPADKKCLV